jgi:hypothetical protein
MMIVVGFDEYGNLSYYSICLMGGWSACELMCSNKDMWGLITRPGNFSPDKKYPIIEYIYQGPGDQYVPKTFIPYNGNMTSLA